MIVLPEIAHSRKIIFLGLQFSCIRLSKKILSFYKEIIDAQCFLFYISLLNYART